MANMEPNIALGWTPKLSTVKGHGVSPQETLATRVTPDDKLSLAEQFKAHSIANTKTKPKSGGKRKAGSPYHNASKKLSLDRAAGPTTAAQPEPGPVHAAAPAHSGGGGKGGQGQGRGRGAKAAAAAKDAERENLLTGKYP